MKKYALLAALCLSLLGPVVPQPAAAEADGDQATVVWPSFTVFNPDHHPFEIRVVDVQPDRRYFLGYPGETSIPADGVLTLAPWEGTRSFSVWECGLEFQDCHHLATSPVYTAVRHITARVPDVEDVKLGPVEQMLAYDATRYVETLKLSWVLLTTGESPDVVASGPIEATARTGSFAIKAPDDVPVGKYRLGIRSQVDAYPLGPMDEIGATVPAVVDRTPPEVELAFEHPTVYAVYDGYRDDLEWSLTFAEPITVSFEVTGPGGDQLWRLVEQPLRKSSSPFAWIWDPRKGGKPRPEGRYTFTAHVTDRGGNATSVSEEFQVSHATHRQRRVVYRIPAARSVVDRSAPGCASIRKPARPGWRGSIGLVSCARGRDVVSTLHGVRLPELQTGRYVGFQLKAVGGASRSRPRSRAAFGYVTRWGNLPRTYTLTSRVRPHALPRVEGHRYFREKETGRPSLYWSVGTWGGDRYDIKRFELSVSINYFG